jgi:hypothetical protein
MPLCTTVDVPLVLVAVANAIKLLAGVIAFDDVIV